MDTILVYLTIISKTVRIKDRLDIPWKFYINFGQVTLRQSVKVALFSNLDGSIDLFHPVVPNVLGACFHPVKVLFHRIFIFKSFNWKFMKGFGSSI